ncbi:M23 family metallopeptidase [Candidatus Poribacteria bacterium]|nr:M23 family metallopeptidase [Candidatus Poribacteria bacterium]
MQRDNVTFILIEDESGKTRNINFSRRGLKWFSAFFIAAFFYGINLLWDYHKMRDELKQIIPLTKTVNEENEILEKEKNEFGIKIRSLNEKIITLRDYDEMLKNKFALNKNASIDQGMGGAEDEMKADDLILKFNNALDEDSEDVLKPVDDLEKEAFFQRESFSELIKFLNTQDAKLKATPAIWPVRGYLTSGFGYRLSPFSGRLSFHKGLDIAGQKGMPVQATADGIVLFSGWQEGYGKLVVIDHGYGYVTFYAHNSRLLVDKWQKVKRRDVISLMGSTGHSTGPHTHYEVHVNGKVENPNNFILEW